MKITVRKVAALAGVSPASVSRYMNSPDSVSAEIAGRIESTLLALDRQPVTRRPKKKIILCLLYTSPSPRDCS